MVSNCTSTPMFLVWKRTSITMSFLYLYAPSSHLPIWLNRSFFFLVSYDTNLFMNNRIHLADWFQISLPHLGMPQYSWKLIKYWNTSKHRLVIIVFLSLFHNILVLSLSICVTWPNQPVLYLVYYGRFYILIPIILYFLVPWPDIMSCKLPKKCNWFCLYIF
jgi:hypothetical protein